MAIFQDNPSYLVLERIIMKLWTMESVETNGAIRRVYLQIVITNKPIPTPTPFFTDQMSFLLPSHIILQTETKMKKCSEETQTLHAGRAKVEPKIFAPRQTPSRGRGKAKI